MDNYRYWKVRYTSWEGNSIWTIARTPRHWTGDDLREAINMYGSGDDPAEIIYIIETTDANYNWDYG